MLTISNLQAAYGKVEVLHGISMDVPKGKVVTLIGSNGAGKTTTMRAISGMIKPKGGTVNLLLGACPRFTRARPKGDIAHDLERALELFPRLKERQTQLAGTLSGGEQQMLAMARAVMLNPDVILLDEPSMGLAPILVDEVFRIILRLKQQGITMLLVEQFAAAALNVADYGYVLENGKISVHGPADKLQNDPAVQAAYLGGGAHH